MLKRAIVRFLPFLKPTQFSIINYPNYLRPSTHSFRFFSNHKENDQAKPGTKKEQKPEKASQSPEPQKAQKVEKPSKQQQQTVTTKQSKLTVEQLIELNTQQSLKLVRNNLANMRNLKQQQQAQIKQLNDSIEFFKKCYIDSITKEQALLENLKNYQEELKRIQVRADKQIVDSKDYGITKIAKEFLQFSDSLNKCKAMAQQLKPNQDHKYEKGIIAVGDQFKKILKMYDIEQFDPINQPFDPRTSEGLTTIPTPQGYQKNHVAVTMMTGYKIKGRLLRSAKVGIFV